MTPGRPALLALSAALLSACLGGGEPPGEAAVELGTGEWRFEPLSDEQEVPLIAGVQGGFHVWASVRAEGLSSERVTLEVETQLADDSLPPEHSRVALQMPAEDGGPVRSFVGWPAVLSRPGCMVDRMVRLRVTLTDAAGIGGTDERIVVPRAGGPIPPPPCE